MIQAHIFYSGTVQGVGFRFTTQQLAADLGLSGWVRNLRDGRVEILAEGDDGRVRQLVEEIDRHFEGYIRDKTIDMCPAQGQSREFRITR